MVKTKRRLTGSEEFQIMKMVMDKFLWIGTFMMGFGLYRSIAVDVQDGIWYIVAGSLIMLAFSWIIIREFETVR